MDKINMKGILSLKYYEKGILIKEETGNNLIVNNGYSKLLSMLNGSNDLGIAKVQIGTETGLADYGNTEITNPVDIPITTRTNTGSKLILTFEIDSTTGNGTTFSEFGLILNDDSLFSRKVWTPFAKIADLTIQGTWEIKI